MSRDQHVNTTWWCTYLHSHLVQSFFSPVNFQSSIMSLLLLLLVTSQLLFTTVYSQCSTNFVASTASDGISIGGSCAGSLNIVNGKANTCVCPAPCTCASCGTCTMNGLPGQAPPLTRAYYMGNKHCLRCSANIGPPLIRIDCARVGLSSLHLSQFRSSTMYLSGYSN